MFGLRYSKCLLYLRGIPAKVLGYTRLIATKTPAQLWAWAAGQFTAAFRPRAMLTPHEVQPHSQSASPVPRGAARGPATFTVSLTCSPWRSTRSSHIHSQPHLFPVAQHEVQPHSQSASPVPRSAARGPATFTVSLTCSPWRSTRSSHIHSQPHLFPVAQHEVQPHSQSASPVPRGAARGPATFTVSLTCSPWRSTRSSHIHSQPHLFPVAQHEVQPHSQSASPVPRGAARGPATFTVSLTCSPWRSTRSSHIHSQPHLFPVAQYEVQPHSQSASPVPRGAARGPATFTVSLTCSPWRSTRSSHIHSQPHLFPVAQHEVQPHSQSASPVPRGAARGPATFTVSLTCSPWRRTRSSHIHSQPHLFPVAQHEVQPHSQSASPVPRGAARGPATFTVSLTCSPWRSTRSSHIHSQPHLFPVAQHEVQPHSQSASPVPRGAARGPATFTVSLTCSPWRSTRSSHIHSQPHLFPVAQHEVQPHSQSASPVPRGAARGPATFTVSLTCSPWRSTRSSHIHSQPHLFPVAQHEVQPHSQSASPVPRGAVRGPATFTVSLTCSPWRSTRSSHIHSQPHLFPVAQHEVQPHSQSASPVPRGAARGPATFTVSLTCSPWRSTRSSHIHSQPHLFPVAQYEVQPHSQSASPVPRGAARGPATFTVSLTCSPWRSTRSSHIHSQPHLFPVAQHEVQPHSQSASPVPRGAARGPATFTVSLTCSPWRSTRSSHIHSQPHLFPVAQHEVQPHSQSASPVPRGAVRGPATFTVSLTCSPWRSTRSSHIHSQPHLLPVV
ncbi:hypothetical protein ACJJTC_018353 [Scirpophaga incertulas]